MERRKVFLAVDIGNSRIKVGLYADGNLTHSFKMRTDSSASVAAYRHSLRKRLGERMPHAAGVSSVVPDMTAKISQAVRDDFMILPVIVGPELVTEFEIDYDPPDALGVDRLCAVAAARERFGVGPDGTGRPLLVVDAGTAITFDLLSGGVYRGGAIMAGPALVASALSSGTAQLQPADLLVPEYPVANSTDSGLTSGIMFGVIDSVAGMIRRINLVEEIAPFVVATGGVGSLLSNQVSEIDVYEPDLVLDGIALLANTD